MVQQHSLEPMNLEAELDLVQHQSSEPKKVKAWWGVEEMDSESKTSSMKGSRSNLFTTPMLTATDFETKQ